MIVNNQKFKMIIHKFRLTKTMAENPVSSGNPLQDTTSINEPLDSCIDDSFEEPPELPYQERMSLAYKAWIDGCGDLTILAAAQTFGVIYSTLYSRIHEAIPKAQAS
jgi:hypothetical protein